MEWVSCMSATRYYCSWLGSRLIITLAKGTNWNWFLRVLLHSNSGVVRQRRIAQYLRRWRSTHWVFGRLGRAQDGSHLYGWPWLRRSVAPAGV